MLPALNRRKSVPIRRLIIVVVVAALAIALLIALRTRSSPPPNPAQSAPAPAAAPAEDAQAQDAQSADAAPLMSASMVEGRDYQLIENGAPFDTPAGKIEVAEFFNYACPACNSFEPKLQEWKRSLPGYVHVVYLALDFRPDFVPYARAYFAAQALGIADQSHEAVYQAIHQTHTLPGEGTPVDAGTLAKFYAQFLVKPEQFEQVLASDAVTKKVDAARAFAQRSQVHSTPSLVIGGKYLVKGQSWEEFLQNATQLIAKERS